MTARTTEYGPQGQHLSIKLKTPKTEICKMATSDIYK